MIQDGLIIDFDPFSRESRVIVVENGQRAITDVSSDVNELAYQLPVFCKKYNQYNVKFHAPVNIFYELQRQLEVVEQQTYGENKINLEIC